MKIAHSNLPNIICSFEKFYTCNPLTLKEFRQMYSTNIKKSSIIITTKFHNKISKIISRTNTFAGISQRQLPQFIRCMTNVFVQQILSLMMKSITYILKMIENNKSYPPISFELIYTKEGLILMPHIVEVYNAFHDILSMIEDVAQDLIPLEESANIKANQTFIKISLPLWFVQESHDKLQNLMNDLFQPIQNHIIIITDQFNISSESHAEKEISDLLSGEIDFSIYEAYIQKYNTYLKNIIMMRNYINYNIGKLDQTTAKKELNKHASEIKDKLIQKLVLFHYEFNQSICSEFEYIKAKALDIPRNAKLLIDLSQYMSHVSKVTINELEKKIQSSISMLCTLLQITILTKDHIELNKTTINWLNFVQQIFYQNNTLSEAMKSELEDDLQNRINITNIEVDKIFPELIILDDMDDIKRISEYKEHFVDIIKNVNKIYAQVTTINSEEQLLKFPETLFPKVIELKEIIKPFHRLIQVIHQWQRDKAVWLNGPFEYLDATIIEKRTLNYHKEITEMHKNFKIKIKSDVATNKLFKFSGIADDPDPLQQPSPLKLCWQALNDINNFKVYLPLAICMCNPALLSRHWEEMSSIANFDLTPNAGTTLKKMIDLDLMNNIEKYEIISLGANKELALQEKLTKMLDKWNTMIFNFSKESEKLVFTKSSEMEILLEEHKTMIEEMKTSYFIKPIYLAIKKFEACLSTVCNILEQWDYLQEKLLYFYPVFTNDRMRIFLSEESSLYIEVTNHLENVQEKVLEDPSFERISQSSNILEMLYNIRASMERIAIGVKQCLEMKRSRFAKLFFLSDNEVQQILFQPNSHGINLYINKCFSGINKLGINKDEQIYSVFGSQGEKLDLCRKIDSNFNCTTELLGNIDSELKNTIHEKIIQCFQVFNSMNISNLLSKFPSMAILCSFHIYWTSFIQNCLLNDLKLLKSCQLECNNFINSLRDELKISISRRYRNIIMTLIISGINKLEIIKLLLQKQMIKELDIEWKGQLRYYLGENIKISVMNSTISYGYEYNTEQLYVINTILTDRCYKTIIEAFRYYLCTYMVGHTGVGKTATVKSLMNSLALQYHIFNTNQNFTYNNMISILKGLISSGAWILFENFDRLKSEVLSACTQQINYIFQTISTNLNFINFEGCQLDIKSSGHICAMVNLKYVKYSKLPDNLKYRFRTFSMLQSDVKKIVEIQLFAGGFKNSLSLSSKLYSVFKLISELILDKEKYLIDIRLIMTVVKVAIDLKISNRNTNEDSIMLRSLIDSNISSLSEKELFVFQNILQNVFPDSEVLTPNYTSFLKAFETVCAENYLNINDFLKLKAIQILELIHIRRANLIIGEPLVGKTETLKALKNTLCLLKEQKSDEGINITLDTISPNVLKAFQLFGYYSNESKKWIDGFCTKLIRQFYINNSFDKQWLVFDGSLTGEWIEHLTTVLDNNDILSLDSGEQISILNSISMFFETDNICQASPAMISRCGIIYIDSKDVDWRSFIISYINKHEIYHNHHKILYSIFEWAISSCLQFQGIICNNYLGKLHLLKSILSLFDMYLSEISETNLEELVLLTQAQIILILSIAWGIGGNLKRDDQLKFNAFCISLWNGTNEEYSKLEEMKQFNIILPSEGLIQDYFYDFKAAKWKNWASSLKDERTIQINNCYESYIPTVTTLKFENLIRKHINLQVPLIIISESGTGKTTLIKSILKSKLPENYVSNIISFNSLLNVEKSQDLLLARLKRIKKWVYKSEENHFCVNFIDDFNLDMSNSKMNFVLELIRQYLNTGHWYQVSDIKKIMLDDIMFLFAITEKCNKTNICPRFARYFNFYSLDSLDSENILSIFSAVLMNNLKNNQFNPDVSTNLSSIVNATISVYNFLIKHFKPIPRKIQYQFSISDIAKVINGCSLIHKESVENKITFIRLWVHETWRVFADRILDDNDRRSLFQIINESVKSNFKDTFESAFDYLPKFEDDQLTEESLGFLYFGNFFQREKNSKHYEEISSYELLQNEIIRYLNEYNAKNSRSMNIVVTKYVVDNFVKICRVLAIPGENLLLIAPAGSGRKSITKLAAFIQRQKVFQVSTESLYDSNIWKEDLKTILLECGAKQNECVFLLMDRQLKESFIRDICCLLSTGEIPGLFSSEENREIIQDVRLLAQNGNRNAELNSFTVLQYFAMECKRKSHFVLCFSPLNDSLKNYFKSYPALSKYCIINCWESWPDETLEQIASRYVEKINISEDTRKNAVTACVKFYSVANEASLKYRENSGKMHYCSLSSYLHMCRLYVDLTARRQEGIICAKKKYLVGLEKLESTARQVKEMKATLTVLKPQLESSARQAMSTLEEVENENISVETARTHVKEEEEIANKKTEITGNLRAECESELAVAIPILEDAIQALNTLKPTDITLCKAMKNPPDVVKLVMAAVCVMLEVPPDKIIDPNDGRRITDYWGPSKRILGDMNFLQNLKDYDKDNIPETAMQIIRKTYMSDKNFVPHIVAKASSAAEGLCKWVRAMVAYDEIAKAVAPKKEKLAAAQKECDEAEAFLNEKRDTLAALSAKLAILNISLKEAEKKRLELETEVNNYTKRLNKAETLIGSLEDEKSRWEQCARVLQESYDNISGDLLLSCGVIAYLAPYPEDFRNNFICLWKEFVQSLKIPNSKLYSFVETLYNETEIHSWQLSGLSKSRVLHENATILKFSLLQCLIVDSQNQANEWIKQIEKDNNLKITKFTDPDYLSVIRHGVENGTPVLLENIDDKLEIALNPILTKYTYRIDDNFYLDIGKETVKSCENYRLYVTTRIAEPFYSPEIFHRLTIVDFTIPRDALEYKLLNIVFSKENPLLQEQFKNISVEDAVNKNVLQEQEDNILSILSQSDINILEDENAIKSVYASKNVFINIIEKQEDTKSIMIKINAKRSSYEEFTKYCTNLYGTLTNLSRLNLMYQISLSWFLNIYSKAIENSKISVIPKVRLEYLKASITRELYLSVCNWLYEEHKLLYSFIFYTKILMHNNQVTTEEMEYFIHSDLNNDKSNANPSPSWISNESWKEICRIDETLPNFHTIANDFQNNDDWKLYCQSETLENNLMPLPWKNKLNSFQKLILIKILRPKEIYVEVMKLIDSNLPCTFNCSPQLKISLAFEESSCLNPILFLLPSSFPPLSLISTFAKKMKCSSTFVSLSLGEELESKALFLIEQAQKEGSWIFLENFHYATCLMMKIEKVFENLNLSNRSTNFRVWISSHPSKSFPISLLQNSIKITYDNSLRFKENMLTMYQTELIRDSYLLNNCPGKEKLFSKFIYGLCFFHNTIKERNHFKTHGWYIPYDFDYFDLQISIQQLKTIINEHRSMPYNTFLYMVGDCNYGNKVLNDFDKNCLNVLLSDICLSSDSDYTNTNDVYFLMPRRYEYRDMILHIENMPLYPPPEIFGADKHAIIIKNISISSRFFQSLLSIYKKDSLVSENDVYDEILSKISTIENNLPNLIDRTELENKFAVKPLNLTLIQEIDLNNSILECMKSSLSDIKLALAGDSIITPELENFCKEIYNDLVPNYLRNKYSIIKTENLGNFISNISKHFLEIERLLKQEHIYIINFNAVCFPKMFLTECLLAFSKKYNISPDKVNMHFDVTPLTEPSMINNTIEDKYFIFGLYLTGAKWDLRKMVLTYNDTNEFYHKMTAICLRFSADECNLKKGHYKCPLYYSICNKHNINADAITIISLKCDIPETLRLKIRASLFCHVE